jgi:hypothetical protein
VCEPERHRTPQPACCDTNHGYVPMSIENGTAAVETSTVTPDHGDAIDTVIYAAIDRAEGAADSNDDAIPRATSSAASADQTDSTPLVRGRIPAERHQEILARTRGEYDAQIADLQKQLDAANLPEVRQRLELMQIAEADPARFVSILAHHPQYAAFLGLAPKSDERPGPDVENPDGTIGYSEQGLQALLEWQQRQTLKPLRPLIDRHEHEQQWQAATERAKAKLAEAERWPHFGEFRDAIKKYYLENKGVTLEQAYQRTVVSQLSAKAQLNEARATWPGFKTYEEKIRAKFLGDDKATLRSAYESVVGPDQREVDRSDVGISGPVWEDNVDKAIRRSIARLKGGAQ